MFIRSLMGSRIFRAPENDQGNEPDLDDDLDPDLGGDDDGAGSGDDDDLPPDDGDADPQGGAPGQDDEPAPRRSRANDAIRAAREAKQASDRRVAELERQVAETLNRRSQPDPAAEETAFQARLAELPYDQQLLAVRDRERGLFGQQLQGLRLELAEIKDEGKFSSLAARNPIAAKHADAVEAEFLKSKANGYFVSREVILKNILGDLALKRGPAAARKDAARGRDNIDRQRANGGARGSDVRSSGRGDPNSLEAIEARLRGVTLDQI